MLIHSGRDLLKERASMVQTDAAFPLSPAELSEDFLTRALRDAGLLTTASVTGFETQVVGEGIGFVGLLARIRLRYDRAEPGAPATLVGKFPSPNEGARQTAAIFGVYAREVGFYQDLGPQCVIGTPKCYYAAVTPDNSGFLLLLEDLDDGRFGDQVAGCTPDEARRILHEAARLHAQWWNNPALDNCAWLQKGTDVVRGAILAAYDLTWPVFLERFRAELTPRAIELGPELGRWMLTQLDTYETRPTYTFGHSDYRVDNIYFPAASGSAPVALDWQGSLRIWSGAYDVAYFLGTGLPTADLRAHGEALMRGYYDDLVALGVTDYPFAQYREDCRVSLLMAFAIIGVIAGGTLDMVNDRAVALFKSFFSRLCAAIEDDKAWDLVQ
jgi:hypothetical protein